MTTVTDTSLTSLKSMVEACWTPLPGYTVTFQPVAISRYGYLRLDMAIAPTDTSEHSLMWDIQEQFQSEAIAYDVWTKAPDEFTRQHAHLFMPETQCGTEVGAMLSKQFLQFRTSCGERASTQWWALRKQLPRIQTDSCTIVAEWRQPPAGSSFAARLKIHPRALRKHESHWSSLNPGFILLKHDEGLEFKQTDVGDNRDVEEYFDTQIEAALKKTGMHGTKVAQLCHLNFAGGAHSVEDYAGLNYTMRFKTTHDPKEGYFVAKVKPDLMHLPPAWYKREVFKGKTREMLSKAVAQIKELIDSGAKSLAPTSYRGKKSSLAVGHVRSNTFWLQINGPESAGKCLGKDKSEVSDNVVDLYAATD